MEDTSVGNKFNALVIAYYFPPMGLSGVQRTLKFVKYLPDFGWNPVVLTTEDNNSYYAYDNSLLNELPEDIQVFRAPEKKKPSKTRTKLPKFPNYFKQKLGRFLLQIFKQPDTKIHWKKFALAKAEEIIKEHDIKIIFATAPPFTDFLIAKELSDKFDIPFVVDYRDSWVDNPFHFFPTIWHKNYNIELEKEILTTSERSFVTTRYAKELLLRRYRFLSHDDVVILPHGFDPEDFDKVPVYFTPHRKLVITHSGLFQDDRTPKYFLKALNLFFKTNPDARKDFELRFVGLMRQSHIRMIKRYKLDDITLLVGYVEHSQAISHLIESTVLWMTVNDTIRTPGKLYEYIGSRKPILFIGPIGQISNIVLETKAGFVADTKNVKEIKHQLEVIYKLWKSDTLPVISDEYANQFDRHTLTGNLARYLSLHAKL